MENQVSLTKATFDDSKKNLKLWIRFLIILIIFIILIFNFGD